MSELIGAGVPLVKALNIVKGQTPNPRLMDDPEQGQYRRAGRRHLCRRHSRSIRCIFTKLTAALVRAGEAGGLLDQTLSAASRISPKTRTN